jgi:RNA polymerase sigma-70 factor (ECF subfamily)
LAELAISHSTASTPADAHERRVADDADFVRQAEPLRPQLLAHCYRMLGSVHDAEDMVQEAYLRAWRSYGAFEGRSSLRSWLYRIATNVCLTALQNRGRRVLPSGLGAPGEDAGQPPALDARWLQPFPDAQAAQSADPAAVVADRESLRLALVASWQLLPDRQRAVLLLRDVLAFPAAEVAEMLETTTSAVNSALQRARTRIKEAAPDGDRIAEPTEPQARAVLERYIAAFENSDAAELERLLRRDASLERPPSPIWFTGGDALADATACLGSAGDWRLLPTAANAQPAAAAYRLAKDGSYRAFGIVVLTVTTTSIARVTVFADPGLFRYFGLPQALPAG